jgi:1,4-dihydroxy-2-naphthoate octaprenyltransferase
MAYLEKISLYWHMARPAQLVAVTLVYSWGLLIALPWLDAFRPLSYVSGLSALLLASASIHYANEYADYETDAPAVRTPFFGGSGALQEYGAPRETALRAAQVTLIAGLMAALTATVFGLLPFLALPLLLLGIIGDWMYSLPPVALARRGWGELTNAFLGGMLLPIWGFTVQAGRLEWRMFLLTLPFMLHVFVNLLATTWADREADRRVGKFTLATRWSVANLRALYFLSVAAAYLSLFLMRDWLLPGRLVWLTALLLPLALWAGYSYARQHSPFPSVFVMVLFLIMQLAGCLALLLGPHLLAFAG